MENLTTISRVYDLQQECRLQEEEIKGLVGEEKAAVYLVPPGEERSVQLPNDLEQLKLHYKANQDLIKVLKSELSSTQRKVAKPKNPYRLILPKGPLPAISKATRQVGEKKEAKQPTPKLKQSTPKRKNPPSKEWVALTQQDLKPIEKENVEPSKREVLYQGHKIKNPTRAQLDEILEYEGRMNVKTVYEKSKFQYRDRLKRLGSSQVAPRLFCLAQDSAEWRALYDNSVVFHPQYKYKKNGDEQKLLSLTNLLVAEFIEKKIYKGVAGIGTHRGRWNAVKIEGTIGGGMLRKAIYFLDKMAEIKEREGAAD